MKFSELKGRTVANLEDARKIGDVQDLMVEPESHNIVSVRRTAHTRPVSDVNNVGTDVVTISTGADTANSAGIDESAGGRQTAERHSRSAGNPLTAPSVSSAESVGSQSLIGITRLPGNRLVTDARTMVGELSDVMVDPVDHAVTGYEVHAGGLVTEAQEFRDTPGVRYRNELLTIPADLLNYPN